MIELLGIIIVPLAVWRISNLLADTDQVGPWEILARFRARVGISFDYNSLPTAKPGSFGEMVLCVYCNSLWVGMIFTLGLLINIRVTTIVSLPFALSAIAILIQEKLK